MKCSVLLLCATAALAAAPFAMAFCLAPQPRLVCAEYFASPLVVEATLVQTRVIHDKDDPEGVAAHVYTMRIGRNFRGKPVSRISIYEGNDSGRAGFDWINGRKYLLFLFYRPDQQAWVLDGCGNSTPLGGPGASSVLSEINAIKSARSGGMIQGKTNEQMLSIPIASVQIEVTGKTQHYVTTTDQEGRFQLQVSGGSYSLLAAKPGFSFKSELSYENPLKLQIEPGGCAQVQLIGTKLSQ